jgi:hypothetical protein
MEEGNDKPSPMQMSSDQIPNSPIVIEKNTTK